MDTRGQLPRRGLSDIAEAMRAAKDRGGKCTLLVGAGCSLSAGIPLSSKIVEDIRGKFPHAYARAQKRAEPPGYGHCMRELSPGQRRDLLKGYIDAASINWAHIGLAQLVKNGCVDRLLTTNFDPLIARACALVNEFPAVYDLTASTYLRPEDLPDHAVFHLHGQRNGFVLLNETAELEKHTEQLKPVFAHAREGRVWIIVGYSGENDPLFRLIRDVDRYEYDLFWVDIKENPAPGTVDFFCDDRRTYYVHEPRGADIFFMALANELEAWPPIFVDQPFEHLRQQLKSVVKQDQDGTGRKIDWLQQAREKIDRAEACLAASPTTGQQDEVGKVQAAFLEGGSDKAVAASKTPELKAWLLASEGSDLDDKARELASTDLAAAQDLWRQAGERYAQALAIKPDLHEAAYNWGNALADQAKALAPSDLPTAQDLWHQAGERYAQALAIKPDMQEAANNWGIALSDQAKALASYDLPTARELLHQASERYAQALATKPDYYEATYNLGNALADQAKSLADIDLPTARNLWRQAGERYAQALAVKPDLHEAANNWGNTLADHAKADAPTDLPAAHEFWRQASERYAQALTIKPDMYDAANNWGTALADQALVLASTDLPAARDLWRRAGECYVQALTIKPDYHEASNNWGIALAAQAEAEASINLSVARDLWHQAKECYVRALTTKPDYYEAANNCGIALTAYAQALTTTDPSTAHELWRQASERYAQALAIKPDYHEAANSWGSALIWLYHAAKEYLPSDRQGVLELAKEKCQQAEAIKPGTGAYNLACVAALCERVAECIDWLDTSRHHGTLPAAKLIRDDKDFDGIRNTPEFIAWWEKAFGSDEPRK